MKDEHLILLGMWLFLGLLIAGFSSQHSTYATSPDSVHYLRVAADWRTYDGTFPPGYPLMIWLVSAVTNVPGLWASKLVNWLILGYFGWAWSRRVGVKRAVWLLAIWLLPGNLRIVTYTWSETVFIVFLLEAVWHLHRFSGEQSCKNAWRISVLLVALFWVRYVGMFVYGGVAFCTAVRCRPLYSLLGIVPLLLLNFFLTGHLFGGPRLLPTEPWPELLNMAGIAGLNELLIYDYLPENSPEIVYLAMLGQFLMIGVMGWGWQKKRSLRATFAPKLLVRLLFVVGATYFLTLFALRFISPFDPLNERLMAPGSICWLVGFVLAVQSWHSIISKSPERAETFTNPS